MSTSETLSGENKNTQNCKTAFTHLGQSFQEKVQMFELPNYLLLNKERRKHFTEISCSVEY